MAVNNEILPVYEHTLNFGNFQFFDDYVISAIYEGVDLCTEKLLEFYSLCKDVFESRPYSIVELRFNSYSSDPSFYIKYSDLLSNIKSHAMVVDQNSPARLSEYEALCIRHCPCKNFYSIGDAVNWFRLFKSPS